MSEMGCVYLEKSGLAVWSRAFSIVKRPRLKVDGSVR